MAAQTSYVELAGDDAAAGPSALPQAHAARHYDLTVIVPVFKTAAYVVQCLASVLDQADVSIQLVVVNDGTPDDSAEIARAFLARRAAGNAVLLSQPNRGLSAARNAGLRLALGEYVAFLDSDDFVTPMTYGPALRFARDGGLDMVLWRSAVLDHERLGFRPFYDARVWDRLLAGADRRVASPRAEPDLLLLEPNTNTRLTRRALIEARGLSYPEGLLFEDLPVHLTGLLAAGSVGLLDHVGYVYRVNRAGKITDARSASRFDALAIIGQSLEAMSRAGISPDMGAAVTYALLRLGYWCGCNTLLEDRQRYFTALCGRFAAIPRKWVRRFHLRYAREGKRRLLLWALRSGRVDYLCRHSLGDRPLWPYLPFLLNQWRNPPPLKRKRARGGDARPSEVSI